MPIAPITPRTLLKQFLSNITIILLCLTFSASDSEPYKKERTPMSSSALNLEPLDLHNQPKPLIIIPS